MPTPYQISNFYFDGEAAFMDGAPLDQNPYAPGDDAAEAWRAGWLDASSAAMSVRSAAFGDLTTRFSSHPF